nr:hypothetical protein [Scenedesmaceae sp. YH-2023b]
MVMIQKKFFRLLRQRMILYNGHKMPYLNCQKFLDLSVER